MAESLKPLLSRSDLNSQTCRSVSATTLVLRIERNSMCRTPHDFRTSIWTWGSGSISSAKALRVNMRAPGWERRFYKKTKIEEANESQPPLRTLTEFATDLDRRRMRVRGLSALRFLGENKAKGARGWGCGL